MVRRAKLLTEQQVDRFTAAAARLAEPCDRAIVELFYGSGVRVSELRRLDAGDVDLAAGMAIVLGKGRKPRTVPLTPDAVDALRAYLGGRTEGPLFLRCGDDARLHPRLCRDILGKRARRAGVPHTSPHTLRYSCASHMLAHGAYFFNVQDLLGHALPQTTALYLHRMRVDRTPGQDYVRRTRARDRTLGGAAPRGAPIPM